MLKHEMLRGGKMLHIKESIFGCTGTKVSHYYYVYINEAWHYVHNCRLSTAENALAGTMSEAESPYVLICPDQDRVQSLVDKARTY